jgi:hypothetical protein
VSKVSDSPTNEGQRCVCVPEELRERLVSVLDGDDPATQEARRELLTLAPCCEPSDRPTVAPRES